MKTSLNPLSHLFQWTIQVIIPTQLQSGQLRYQACIDARWSYHIAQNSGRVKLWQIDYFRILVRNNIGEFTIANISYSAIWLGKVLVNAVQFTKFAQVFPVKILCYTVCNIIDSNCIVFVVSSHYCTSWIMVVNPLVTNTYYVSCDFK